MEGEIGRYIQRTSHEEVLARPVDPFRINRYSLAVAFAFVFVFVVARRRRSGRVGGEW